jgi:hypothetical protein
MNHSRLLSISDEFKGQKTYFCTENLNEREAQCIL